MSYISKFIGRIVGSISRTRQPLQQPPINKTKRSAMASYNEIVASNDQMEESFKQATSTVNT